MHPVKPITIEFPDPDWFKDVSIVPLFIEPVTDSGERICVGVVAVDDTGVKSLPVNLRRLRCLYGDGQRILELAAVYSLKSLEAHVIVNGMTTDSLARWEAPVDGVVVGEPTHTNSKSIDRALDLYLTKHSSLAATAAAGEEDEREERGASLSSSRLERLVREEILAAQPSLSECFGRKFWVKEGARPFRLAFAGQRLVANFTLLWPTQLSGAVRLSKSKLWDLAQARDGLAAGWFGKERAMAFELLVHHATEADVTVSNRGLAMVGEALEELEAEADKYELRSRAIVTPTAMAKFVVEQELLAA